MSCPYFTEEAQQVFWEQYIWIVPSLRRVPSVGCEPHSSTALIYRTIDHWGHCRCKRKGLLYSLKVFRLQRRDNGMLATKRWKLCIVKVKWKWTQMWRLSVCDPYTSDTNSWILFPQLRVWCFLNIRMMLITCFEIRAVSIMRSSIMCHQKKHNLS
jgi:hypothetical protein